MTTALRAVMLAAEGVGGLAGDEVSHGRAEHPVCGDVLELECELDGERIVDIGWRAQGCPATMAVAAAARAALRGQEVAAAPSRMRARLAELGGLAATESHALSLFLRALREAVES